MSLSSRSPTPHRDWLRAEAVLDAFEEAWQSGKAPRIADHLEGSADRQALLLELVQIDSEYRSASGYPWSVDDYVAQFPELSASREELLHLGEFDDRRATATTVDKPVRARRKRSCSPASPPQRLGTYEIRQRLGAGAFSTVYRAWDPELRREVAIKVPHPALCEDAEGAARFRREASSAARLRHPAIVPLHQVSGEGDTTFLVYQYIPGPTLAQVLKEARPAPEQAAHWTARLAEALAYAHECGIVHRDVKPANILMDQHGEPMLADFGLAMQADASVRLTHQGDILGTPAYMSPEQASGGSHAVDARTDIYSLGVLLYEMLCGRPPFAGSSASVLRQVLTDEPPSLRRNKGAVPLDLETICMKAMAKEPGQRYATAVEFAEDLHRFLRHEPIQARRIGPVGRVVRWCRRNPALATTIAAAVLAVATVAGLSYRQVLEERDNFRNERDKAQANLYRALISDTQAQYIARDTGWWWKAMDNLREAAQLKTADRDIKQLRELAIEGFGTPYHSLREHAAWDSGQGVVTEVALSPDERYAATGGKDQTVRVWSLALNGRLHAEFTGHKGTVTSVAFHPGGRFLASTSADGALCIWDLEKLSGEPLHRRVLADKSAAAAVFSPAGDVLAAAGGGEVFTFDAQEESLPIKLQPLQTFHADASVTCLKFSPSGAILASGDTAKMVRLWDLAVGGQVLAWNVGQTPTNLAFDRTGNMVTWSEIEGFGFGFRNLAAGVGGYFAHTHGSRVNQVQIDANVHVYTASADGTILMSRVPNVATRATLAVARVTGAGVTGFVLTNDASRIIAGYSDGKLRIWENFHPAERSFVPAYCQSLCFRGNSHSLLDDFRLVHSPNNPACEVYKPVVRALAVQGTGNRFAWCAEKGLYCSDLAGGPARAFDSAKTFTALAADRKGRLLASASSEGIVEIWDWQSGKRVRALSGTLPNVTALSWSPDERYLAAAGEHGFRLWDARKSWKPLKLEAISDTRSIAVGNHLLALARGDHAIEIRSLPAGTIKHVLRGHAAPVSALRFFENGDRLASLGQLDAIRIWDTSTGTEVERFQDQLKPSGRMLAVDPQGRYLAASMGSSVLLWDLRSKKIVGPFMHAPNSSSFHFLPDGSACIFSDPDGGLRLTTIADVEETLADARGGGKSKALAGLVPFATSKTLIPGGNSDRVWAVASSPDGKWFATGCHDGSVHLWDGQSLKKIRAFDGHKNLVWHLAFSPDSKLLAVGAGDVKVWDVASGTEVRRWDQPATLIRGVAFHPTRPLLATAGSDGAVRLWDVSTGEALGILHRFSKEVMKVAFHPDGDHLAAACMDNHVAVWKLPDRSCGILPPAHLLKAHPSGVWAVAFSPDGNYLASSSANGTIILWDAKTFAYLVTLKSDAGEVRNLSFSADSQLLAGAAYVNPCVVWDLPMLRRSLKDLNLDW